MPLRIVISLSGSVREVPSSLSSQWRTSISISFLLPSCCYIRLKTRQLSCCSVQYKNALHFPICVLTSFLEELPHVRQWSWRYRSFFKYLYSDMIRYRFISGLNTYTPCTCKWYALHTGKTLIFMIHQTAKLKFSPNFPAIQ